MIRKKHLYAAGIFLLLPLMLQAQLSSQDMNASEAAGEAVDGIASVAEMIISDSFTPMTEYDRGDLSWTGSAALFKIEQAHEEPLVEGRDFGGWSAGMGAGHAVRDRWLLYGILSGMHMDGTLFMQPYESVTDKVETDTRFSFLSLNGGLGYEVFENSWLSLPVFFGPHLQYYSVSLSPDDAAFVDGPDTYTFTSSITGNGLLFGFSGGAAAYIKVLGRFAFTPYVIGMANLTGPDIQAEITATGAALPFPFTYTSSVQTDPLCAVMFGLDVGYRSRSGWTYSFALGDLLAYIFDYGNTMVKDGVRMRPLIFIASYSK